MNNTTDNQRNRLPAIAERLPQLLRNRSATPFRNGLEYIQMDEADDDGYLSYEEVTPPTRWAPPGRADLTPGRIMVQYVLPVAVGVAALAGVLSLFIWVITQIKFWMIVIGWMLVALAFNNFKGTRGAGQRTPDTPKVNQTGNGNGHNIFINHSGNGDINVNL